MFALFIAHVCFHTLLHSGPIVSACLFERDITPIKNTRHEKNLFPPPPRQTSTTRQLSSTTDSLPVYMVHQRSKHQFPFSTRLQPRLYQEYVSLHTLHTPSTSRVCRILSTLNCKRAIPSRSMYKKRCTPQTLFLRPFKHDTDKILLATLSILHDGSGSFRPPGPILRIGAKSFPLVRVISPVEIKYTEGSYTRYHFLNNHVVFLRVVQLIL